MQKARSYYTSASPIRKINLNIEAIAKLNEPFMLKATDEDGYSAQITSDFIVETALKRAMDKSTVQKTDGTFRQYYLSIRKFILHY